MDAEECMQDAFVKLFTGRKMHFISNKACYAWLRKVALRGAIDRLRSLDFQMSQHAETIDSKVIGDTSREKVRNGQSFWRKKGMMPERCVSLKIGWKPFLPDIEPF